MHRINIGCGMFPTNGWLNYDNSLSLKLAKFPLLANILFKLKLVSPQQMAFIDFCKKNNIAWADAAHKIPLPDNSVEVIYSSAMFEHLDRAEAKLFLEEAKRVLASGSIIRLAAPDIKKLAEAYIEHGNADSFVESTLMCVPRPRSLSDRILILLVGTRHHQWMYDKSSLCKLLNECGFNNAMSRDVGSTQIPYPHPLDLYERADEQFYVEATKA